jgi:tripartite-type tricarboxylate transporter receptor subunit TctC
MAGQGPAESNTPAMTLPRRTFLRLAAAAAALPARSRAAHAQAYPTRPVHVIEGFGAGASNDVLARLIGQLLQDRLGQPFVVENRPGAAGNIATDAVVKSPADGYTLLLVGPSNMINATLYERLSFDFIREIAPCAAIMEVPNVVVISPSISATTIPELIAYAKANPGKLNMGSSGVGGVSHVSGELFKMMAGVDMVHVPYRGGAPALTDLLGGQVQVVFSSIPSSVGYVKDGRLRALAVTSRVRAEALPDIPALGEFLPGFEASGAYGLGAPKSTPAEIIARLNTEINAALADPKIQARLADLGGLRLSGSPADFGKLIAEETEKWAKVIRAANIKL